MGQQVGRRGDPWQKSKVIDVGTLAPELEARGGGLYVARQAAAVRYGEGAHAACRALEDDSFWFEHRNHVILDALARFRPPGFVLDVGGGNGCVAAALARNGYEVALLEPGADGVAAARARRIPVILQATFAEAGLAPRTLPAAGLFDVLEHVEADRELLAGLREALVDGGRLYLTVPAFDFLWSRADDQAGHCRRYTPRSVAWNLAAAGFEVEFVSCFFAFLTVPILVGRRWRDRLSTATPRDESAEHRPGGLLAAPVAAAAAVERAWLGRVGRLPIGSSVIAVARRV